MIRLECDYAEGAHERILRRLFETNLEQTPGYGHDRFCEEARSQICDLCEEEDLDVHFLVGGTQANATVIDAALRPYQGVIAATTAHIANRETGAIEAAGHKVLVVPSADGTISALDVRRVWEAHRNDPAHEHAVQPAMVYLSQPTENGTLYSLVALEEIARTCHELGLILYIDGARMGYGLMSERNDVGLPDLARLCDAFTIGGTKQGMLFGEAVVLRHPALRRDFRYLIKQHGGLLAKGRLLGVQFCAMLEDGLYFDLARQADDLAMLLRRGLEERGYEMLYDSWTNQQYPILPDDLVAYLEKSFAFKRWRKVNEDHTAPRLSTSWATERRAVERLLEAVDRWAEKESVR